MSTVHHGHDVTTWQLAVIPLIIALGIYILLLSYFLSIGKTHIRRHNVGIHSGLICAVTLDIVHAKQAQRYPS